MLLMMMYDSEPALHHSCSVVKVGRH